MKKSLDTTSSKMKPKGQINIPKYKDDGMKKINTNKFTTKKGK